MRATICDVCSAVEKDDLSAGNRGTLHRVNFQAGNIESDAVDVCMKCSAIIRGTGMATIFRQWMNNHRAV